MRVLVTQPIPEIGIHLLQARCEVVYLKRRLSREEILDLATDADAIVCSVTDRIDQVVFDIASQLKVVSNVAVGYDNIDLMTASARGVVVTNTPNTLIDSVAEFVFAHILAVTRRIVESDRYVRTGQFTGWTLELMLGREIKGKTMGVIGFGRIGQALVPMARGFGMKILYANTHGEVEQYASNPEVQHASIDVVLREADYVVLLVPLSPQTRHLITYDRLTQMKRDAVLINMARGLVVREADLVRALSEKVIAGAGLDVYEFEPQVTKELLDMPNVVLTPHIGSATHEARNRMAERAAQNVLDVLFTGSSAFTVNTPV